MGQLYSVFHYNWSFSKFQLQQNLEIHSTQQRLGRAKPLLCGYTTTSTWKNVGLVTNGRQEHRMGRLYSVHQNKLIFLKIQLQQSLEIRSTQQQLLQQLEDTLDLWPMVGRSTEWASYTVFSTLIGIFLKSSCSKALRYAALNKDPTLVLNWVMYCTGARTATTLRIFFKAKTLLLQLEQTLDLWPMVGRSTEWAGYTVFSKISGISKFQL